MAEHTERLRVTVKFSVDPIKQLNALKDAVRKRITKKAITKAARTVKGHLKSAAPKFSGALRVSLASKVTAKKNSVTGIVGPKSAYTKTKKGRLFRPVRYAHILEFGSKKMAARHWMKAVWQSHKAAYLEEVRKISQEEIAKELAKKRK